MMDCSLNECVRNYPIIPWNDGFWERVMWTWTLGWKDWKEVQVDLVSVLRVLTFLCLTFRTLLYTIINNEVVVVV